MDKYQISHSYCKTLEEQLKNTYIYICHFARAMYEILKIEIIPAKPFSHRDAHSTNG